jgi:hypothetical protein
MKLKIANSFKMVWDSNGTGTEVQASVWSPSLHHSMFKSNKIKICLGYFGVKGFSNPGNSYNRTQLVCEIEDKLRIRLNRKEVFDTILAAAFPHPVRFKRLWHMKRGENALYSWTAVAPDGFIALGQVITQLDEDPDPDCIRCIPKEWAAKSITTPQRVWDDTGAGGGKPGSMWVINSQGLIAMVPGHDAPKEQYWDFAQLQALSKGMVLSAFKFPA